MGSLKRKELWEACVSCGAERRIGFGLHGMVRSIVGCRSERLECKTKQQRLSGLRLRLRLRLRC